MKKLLLVILVVGLVGCAAAPAKVTMENDWRTGTEYSPYRSSDAVLQCSDCRYE